MLKEKNNGSVLSDLFEQKSIGHLQIKSLEMPGDNHGPTT